MQNNSFRSHIVSWETVTRPTHLRLPVKKNMLLPFSQADDNEAPLMSHVLSKQLSSPAAKQSAD